MNQYSDKKEDKKGGLLGSLFHGLGNGASSGAGGAGGLGSLLTTKAGIVGIVVTGSAIAAGITVVMNMGGPSSAPTYSSAIFQNEPGREPVAEARDGRAAQVAQQSRTGSASLEYFKTVAKQDGVSGLAGSEGGGEGSAMQQVQQADSPSRAAQIAKANLVKSDGFKSASMTMPKLSGGGAGMSGGMNSPFQPVYKPTQKTASAGSYQTGKAGVVIASAARPPVSMKGSSAFGQAKFANKASLGASMVPSAEGGKQGTTYAFEGGRMIGSDVGPQIGGAGGIGVGGAGIANGPGMKPNDPNLNQSSVEPPTPGTPKNDTPWQNLMDQYRNM
ncbi:MAG: hypothetical protein HY399_07520, partial [Elusimicrobia bacterium]|nr:hypothetical protein [Elusimicrobiota bacterium]